MIHVFRLTVMVMVSAGLTACIDGEATSTAVRALDFPGCDPDDTEFNCRCSGCGANSVPQADWNNMSAQTDRVALAGVQAWDWEADGPRSLCNADSVTATGCTMRTPWSNWVQHSARHSHMMMNMVKVIATKGYIVADPQGVKYRGEFGLAPDALRVSWRYPDQEIVTGGMLALADAIHGVPVCLKTVRTPDNCATAGPSEHEGSFSGNTFRMHYAAVWGGAAAQVPSANLRFGTLLPGSAAEFTWQQHRCAVSGAGAATSVAHCDDDIGNRWKWVVVVVTPFRPGDWYYQTGDAPRPRPASVPPVRE